MAHARQPTVAPSMRTIGGTGPLVIMEKVAVASVPSPVRSAGAAGAGGWAGMGVPARRPTQLRVTRSRFPLNSFLSGNSSLAPSRPRRAV